MQAHGRAGWTIRVVSAAAQPVDGSSVHGRIWLDVELSRIHWRVHRHVRSRIRCVAARPVVACHVAAGHLAVRNLAASHLTAICHIEPTHVRWLNIGAGIR
jgi:hypothetical protein